ncbi:copper chaperone PCu(A)C [Roseovarius sp. S4756]|uniref:copper chaperone PCu(A)C n=1 Tax=Roseovarius maritimus TaxID=3342637 RepID=UPI00372C8C78
MSITLRSIVASAALFAAMPAFAADITVEDAYARSASPTSKTGAAFMQIVNHGAQDRLIGASSPAADIVQLHTHIESGDGVMKMVHVEEGFELPADGMISMQRGGKHVMMMGLTAPLAQGATVPVTLTFEKAGEMTVDVPVDLERMPGDSMEQGMSHSEGHDMDHGEKKSD